MKKEKRLIVHIMGILMTAVLFALTGTTSRAQVGAEVYYWQNFATGEEMTIPIVTNAEIDYLYLANYCDFDEYDLIADLGIVPEDYSNYQDYLDLVDFANSLKGTCEVDFHVDLARYYQPGEQITLQLPVLGIVINAVECYSGMNALWDIAVSGDVVTLTCIDEDVDVVDVQITIRKSPSPFFWLIPMEKALNAAAKAAAATKQPQVAEVCGDFALPYYLMVWLEQHSDVTLLYHVTYDGEKFDVLIQGGNSISDPAIPWYGPLYLKGKFLRQ